MNKYQEALDCIKRFYTESEHYDEEDIRLLQELVDKATPKKIIKIDKKDIYGVRKESITDIVGYMCECPNCKTRFGWLSISPYCRFCGQAFGCGDEDDK